MPDALRRPGCGSGLAADAPEGLCPECLLKDAYIVRKEPSEILLAGYRMWRASMMLLAGDGLYGSWRSRRRGRAEDIKTILPEIDPPQTGSARYFDSP